jgi:GDP-4-dehydro-6-deoxy-D-mannose reductase
MRCLITGMAGFAGRYLAELLRKTGDECLGFDHPEAVCADPACYKLDLLDAKALEDLIAEIRPERIYHLAAQSGVGRSWKNPENTFRINVLGTLNLLQSARKEAPSARMLLVSTGEVYGKPRADGSPLTEDDEPDPQNPYALSKLAAELYAGLYARLHGLEIIRVRPLGHTGPGQAKGFVAPDFASQVVAIEKGIKEPVMKVGNLEARREFMDVRDVVRAYLLLMRKGRPGEVYNIASGKLYSIREMLDISGAEIRVEVYPERFRPVEMAPLMLDSSRLSNLMGWNCEYDLHKTLSELLDYFRSEMGDSVEPSSRSGG